MQNMVYFVDKESNQKVYLNNGLHQGSILSPLLFNIYAQ